ncbi:MULTISPECIES: GNAT family N-acetyltransferase [unclassified Vibrio]|uniref:GNAT family N-acetyltransferase n=1 Tax=unclassified Vibrio TaxID=2614977 RepID=UPI002F411131
MNVQFVLNPPKNIKDVIYSGLKSFNMRHLPDEDIQTLACYVEDDQGHFAGGLTGEIYTNTIFVEFLWVDDQHRDSGIGSMLMVRVESEAKAFGVTDMYLDTYSFQAPNFYTKLGFKEMGRYKGFPTVGVDKIFLQKKIQ